MNSGSPLSLSPPPIPPSHGPAPIRRHHTISSPSRPVRTSHRAVISEESHDWNDDEYVPEPDEWNSNSPAGAVGAVGETPNKPLHRQASLPTGYSRDLRNVRSSAHMANRVNSLSAITAEHGGEGEGEDEDWEQEIPWNREDNSAERSSSPPSNASNSGVSTAHRNQPLSSPLSPMFTPPHVPSPPLASGANVRRHQSLTYGAASSAGGASKLARTATGGKRTGGRLGALALGVVPPIPRTNSAVEDNEEEEEEPEWEREDSTPPSPIARAVWGDTRAGYGASPPLNQEWRDDSVDDIQRALGALEMQTRPGANRGVQHKNLAPSVSPTPPRFSSSPGPPTGLPAVYNAYAHQSLSPGQNLRLVTEVPSSPNGPISASPYVPQVGHKRSSSPSVPDALHNSSNGPSRANSMPAWDQKERSVRNEGFNNFGKTGYNNQSGNAFGYSQVYPGSTSFVDPAAAGIGMGAGLGSGMSNLQGMNPLMNMNMGMGMNLNGMGMGLSPFGAFGNGIGNGVDISQQNRPLGNMAVGMRVSSPSSNVSGIDAPAPSESLASPIDIAGLVASKGYNPTTFDIRPPYARFFVIKSYTEDDVHKSLKYEIWSSTDPGNKRLDKAFRETAGRGPIYLFFSVNASGHFCGMAEMLTPVDYTRSSTVWAQDKWKGVFKVRWIFVRDIPNAMLRGIRLENTQERKPVTNSRDTQELLPDAGSEMLRIFLTHAARTSLLQDFAYYELQSMQKAAASIDGDQPDTPPQRLDQSQQRQYQSQQQQQQQYQRQQFQGPGYGSSQDPTMPPTSPPQREQYLQQQMQRTQYNTVGQYPESFNHHQQATRPYSQRMPSQASSGSSGGF